MSFLSFVFPPAGVATGGGLLGVAVLEAVGILSYAGIVFVVLRLAVRWTESAVADESAAESASPGSSPTTAGSGAPRAGSVGP